MRLTKSFRKLFVPVLVATVMSHIPAVQAQEAADKQEFALEPVLVTTTTPVKLQDVHASITVITREEIEQKHFTTFYDLLQHVDGMHTTLYADGVGFEVSGETNPTIRGSRYVTVLIDGVPQTLASLFRSNAVKYNMDDIERVEILRGSASTLYGANTAGGAINIITRKNVQGVHNKISYAGGSYGLNNIHFSSIGSENKFFWAFSADKNTTDYMRDGHGDKRTSDVNATSGDFKLGYNLSNTVDVVFKYNRNFQDMEWVRRYTLYDRPGNGIYATSRTTFLVDYNAKDGKEKNQFSIYRGTYKNRRYFESPVVAPSSEFGDDKSLIILNRYYKQLNDKHRLAAGFEYHKAEVVDKNPVGEAKEKSLYLQDEWDISDTWKLTLGARYIDPDNYNARTMKSISLGHKFSDKVNAYVSSNEYYVTPSLRQIHGNKNNTSSIYHFIPNLDLESTWGRTNEIGAKIAFDKKNFLDFAIYERNQKDAIGSVKLNPADPDHSNSQYVNISGTTKIKGAEVTYHKQFDQYFKAKLGYAHISADEPSLIAAIARDQITAGLSYTRDKYNINLDGIGLYDIVPPSGYVKANVKYLPEQTYWIWNLSMNYKAADNLNVFLRVNNLMDLYYMSRTEGSATPHGWGIYSAPGRNFVLGAELSF